MPLKCNSSRSAINVESLLTVTSASAASEFELGGYIVAAGTFCATRCPYTNLPITHKNMADRKTAANITSTKLCGQENRKYLTFVASFSVGTNSVRYFLGRFGKFGARF